MTFKVNLVVEGVDTLSDNFDQSPASSFEDVHWRSAAGLTLAVLFTDGDPVVEACTFSRRLDNSRGGSVVRVFDEFVNTTEIAHRLDVTRQTVRNWIDGSRGSGGFPAPDHHHGQHGEKGAMKVWRWADVNVWLSTLGLDDGVDYPTRRQMVEIDSHLHRLEEPVGTAWKQTSVKDKSAEIRSIIEAAIHASVLEGSLESRDSRASLPDVFLITRSPAGEERRITTKESKYEVVSRPPVILKGYK